MVGTSSLHRFLFVMAIDRSQIAGSSTWYDDPHPHGGNWEPLAFSGMTWYPPVIKHGWPENQP